MNAYLFNPSSPLQRILLTNLTILGSDNHCQIVSPTADGRHARIEKQHQIYIIRDLRSQAGTYVNNQRVSEAPLSEGDVLRIGDDEYKFSFHEYHEVEEQQFDLKSRNEDWNTQLQRMGNAAKTQFPVLILGQSGTGKEVLAHAIHKSSSRSRGPFVSVNCSALTETLIESELFGHIKGSFTGALNDRKGAFEAARGGTLFLDEIGDLPIHLQAKLLRALENDEIRPVGSDSNVKTDVRILAATHQNLREKIKNGQFRADLYYRLNVICIESPSLKSRIEDFEDLLYTFAKQFRVRFSFGAIEELKKHQWPGNIRELKNTVARASAQFPKNTIEAQHVKFIIDAVSFEDFMTVQPLQIEKSTPHSMLKEMEKQMIVKKLAANYGNQRATASDLGIPKSTLHDRLRTYNIDPKSFSRTATI